MLAVTSQVGPLLTMSNSFDIRPNTSATKCEIHRYALKILKSYVSITGSSYFSARHGSTLHWLQSPNTSTIITYYCVIQADSRHWKRTFDSSKPSFSYSYIVLYKILVKVHSTVDRNLDSDYQPHESKSRDHSQFVLWKSLRINELDKTKRIRTSNCACLL